MIIYCKFLNLINFLSSPQIKNLLYHGVKECVSVLQNNIPSKDLCTCKPVETNTTSTQFSAPSAQDQRDLMIERLQAELETVRKNSTRYKEIAVAKEVWRKF